MRFALSAREGVDSSPSSGVATVVGRKLDLMHSLSDQVFRSLCDGRLEVVASLRRLSAVVTVFGDGTLHKTSGLSDEWGVVQSTPLDCIGLHAVYSLACLYL